MEPATGVFLPRCPVWIRTSKGFQGLIAVATGENVEPNNHTVRTVSIHHRAVSADPHLRFGTGPEVCPGAIFAAWNQAPRYPSSPR